MATARRLAPLLNALALAGLAPTTAWAEPQANAGLTLGVAGRGQERAVWDQSVFHAGLRGDVLFGRTSSRTIGIGPYAEVLTHAFDEIQFGAGVSTLLPVLDTFPLVLSAGLYGRTGESAYGVNPGVAAALFWGSRSYNFHANYGMAGGLLAEMRLGLGDSRETAVVLAAQIDLALMAMPVVFLVNAFQPSPEAAPLR